jgi:hypothetical protein
MLKKRKLLKLLLCCIALTTCATKLMAQANYWNLGSTYFNCNTGTTSGAPTAIVDLDASAFTVPGICQAFYRVNWVNVWGPPHGNALVITDVSANPSGHPFNGSGDQYYLINDGYMHQGASVAVGPLAANGTRKVYATYDNLIQSWTINSNGTVSGPLNLYTYPPGTAFDSRTATEVSADGNYLLINKLGSPSSAVIVFDLSNNTPANYPSPAGSVTGFEYVTGWSGTPRIYVSYNNMWFNPSGASGFGYYDLGNTSTFNNITTPPAGTDIRGFGFTDIEKAKNGKLYLVYNPTLSTSISNPGTLYSYSSAGVWAVVPSVSITYGQYSNWGYYIQTQIDGENYNIASYPAPTLLSLNLNGIAGSGTPSYAGTPTVYRCSGGPVNVNSIVSGMLGSYDATVRTGSITVSNTFNVLNTYSVSVASSSSSNTLALAAINGALNTYTGDIQVTYGVNNACTSVFPTTRYYRIANASALSNYTKPGCNGLCSKPIQTVLPITTPAPAINSVIGTFRTNIDAAQGWMGAGSAGMYGINTNGNWSMSVYEVDDVTGVRKVRSGITAPTIAFLSGIGNATGNTRFNDNSYAFDPGNPPFYNDVASAYGDGPYFSEFYTESRINGTLASDFSTRVYCAELTVIEPTSGCTVTTRSFFKIANNGPYANGSNAKPGNDEEGEETTRLSEGGDEPTSLNVYPNPASSSITVKMPPGATNATFLLKDNSGKTILEHNGLKAGTNEIDIRRQASGMYLYELNINGQPYHGKLIKQ